MRYLQETNSNAIKPAAMRASSPVRLLNRQLLRLEQPVAPLSGTCDWLLVRQHATEVEDDGIEVSTYDVLRATPQVADGLEAELAQDRHRDRYRGHRRRDDLAVLEHFPMKVVVRIAIELLGSLK